ncbi:3542_t:CDS:2, partial [Dentiscutata heterogama]
KQMLVSEAKTLKVNKVTSTNENKYTTRRSPDLRSSDPGKGVGYVPSSK